MPIYEYECLKCEHRFQMKQNFSDPIEKHCPKCQGELRKLISPSAIQFKGTGWYVTDYARKNSPSQDKSPEKPKESKETVATTNTKD